MRYKRDHIPFHLKYQEENANKYAREFFLFFCQLMFHKENVDERKLLQNITRLNIHNHQIHKSGMYVRTHRVHFTIY